MNKFSFIACNSTIASSKLRQEHKNLGTIQSAKFKGAHEPPICKQLEPKCKSNKTGQGNH